jgi:NADH-quinone oxidoreductase subunit E
MDNEKVDTLLEEYQGKAGSLIRVLMEIQHEMQWLSREVLVKVSERLEVPFSQVLQVATFYKTFRLEPPGRHEVHVCMGTSCHVRGSQRILDKVSDVLGIKPGETDSQSRFTLVEGNCLGACTLGPEMIIDGDHHSRVTPDHVEEILKKYD